MVKTWFEGIKTLMNVAISFPQTAYVGMAMSLQVEWQYVCRVVPDITMDLAPVKTTIRLDFLPALVGGSTSITSDDNFCQLLGHSIKMGGIGIDNPTLVADRLFAASKSATSILVNNLVISTNFLVEAHCSMILQASAQLRKDRATKEKHSLRCSPCINRAFGTTSKLQRVGARLTAMQRQLNGMHLLAQEFQDALRLQYEKRLLDLEDSCDGCCQPFSVEQLQDSLSCVMLFHLKMVRKGTK
ncbi:hypothetical protein ACHAXS_000248 [Conticribra weissflogii]